MTPRCRRAAALLPSWPLPTRFRRHRHCRAIATAALLPPPRYCSRPAALMPIAPALLPRCRRDMTLAEGVGCTTIDGLRSTVAVDDTRRLQTRGSGTERGGWWGRSRATCGWGGGRRRSADATREEAAAAGGGAMRKWKWCVLCPLRKSLGSR